MRLFSFSVKLFAIFVPFSLLVYQISSVKHFDELLTSTPDVFMIGAMKCGTTSLHKLFKRHPDWCCVDEKEKHWFDQTRYRRGPEEYKKLYSECPKSSYLMDATPSYIRSKDCPERIKASYAPKDFEKKKFILSLREPVSRYYSEYQFRVRLCLRGYENETFKLMVREIEHEKDVCLGSDDDTDDDRRYHRQLKHKSKRQRADRNCKKVTNHFVPGQELHQLQFQTFQEWTASESGLLGVMRGHYLSQIEHWLRFVPRGQLFILQFDTLAKNTGDVMERLQRFLKVPKGWDRNVTLPIPSTPKPPPVIGKGVSTAMDCETYDMLEAHYSVANKNLADRINGKFVDKSESLLWGHRPLSEPAFPEFESSRSKCVGKSHFKVGQHPDPFPFDEEDDVDSTSDDDDEDDDSEDDDLDDDDH